MDKKEALEIESQRFNLRDKLKEFANDRDVVLKEVLNNGLSIKFASNVLKDDKELLLLAIRTSNYLEGYSHESAMEYASERLKNDKDLILENIKCNYYAAKSNISESMKKDSDIIEMKKLGKKIEAIKVDANNLGNFPELQDDKDIVMMAVSRNGRALYTVSERLKDDKEVVLLAVSDGTGVNKNIKNCSLSNRCCALEYASERLRCDKEIVEKVLETSPNLEFVCDELKNDIGLTKQFIQINSRNLEYAPATIKDDKEFIMSMLQKDEDILRDTSDRLKNDPEIVMKAVSIHGTSLQYASDELKNNKNIVLAAIKSTATAYLNASNGLRNDEEIVSIAFKLAGEYDLGEMFEENGDLLTDNKFILDTLSENPYIMNFLNDEQKKDKELQMAYVKAWKSLNSDLDSILEWEKIQINKRTFKSLWKKI